VPTLNPERARVRPRLVIVHGMAAIPVAMGLIVENLM
jgi:hypothetical protein